MAAVGLVAQAASAQTLAGFHQMAGTSRVAFFSRTAGDFGGRQKADVKRTDAFLARMEKTLEQPLAAPISYYRYDRPEDIAAETGVYAYGLTRVGDSVVHSTSTYHPHELVHAVAGGLGDPGRFFHEGLAVALGDEGKWSGREVDALAQVLAAKVDRKTIVKAFDTLPADVAYPVAGAFVKHLITQDGLPKLIEFFRACPKSGNVDAAFLKIYGHTFQGAFAEWQQEVAA